MTVQLGDVTLAYFLPSYEYYVFPSPKSNYDFKYKLLWSKMFSNIMLKLKIQGSFGDSICLRSRE